MYISYENELGKINLNGGVWRICEIEGLGLLEKDEVFATYPDTDGQELLSCRACARTITMSGDIIRRGCIGDELQRAMKIFNRAGVLKIQSGAKQRKIFCRCSMFSAPTSDRNALYQRFVLSLTADYPYFEDFEKKKISLFFREDKISKEFTLPCVFSERVSKIRATNAGDIDSALKIFVICSNAGTDDQTYGIEIINHTLNQKFTLIYKMAQGEEICVDFENRKVESNIKTEENNNGNLICFISDDTFLSEFYLSPGINILETISLDVNCKISAFAEFSNKYVEAVV